jgi:hypothetical protein
MSSNMELPEQPLYSNPCRVPHAQIEKNGFIFEQLN